MHLSSLLLTLVAYRNQCFISQVPHRVKVPGRSCGAFRQSVLVSQSGSHVILFPWTTICDKSWKLLQMSTDYSRCTCSAAERRRSPGAWSVVRSPRHTRAPTSISASSRCATACSQRRTGFDIVQRLETLLGADRVDLVILPEANAFLAADVVRGELLLATDLDAEAELQLYYLRRAADLAPLLS